MKLDTNMFGGLRKGARAQNTKETAMKEIWNLNMIVALVAFALPACHRSSDPVVAAALAPNVPELGRFVITVVRDTTTESELILNDSEKGLRNHEGDLILRMDTVSGRTWHLQPISTFEGSTTDARWEPITEEVIMSVVDGGGAPISENYVPRGLPNSPDDHWQKVTEASRLSVP
ncbi:hypothetical protein [Luteolibacter sp. Populi]|uniref:hypothetical protein n=1 Tax=Luteolibacter sp. Populi TaxID=3230487 RepID=UPI003467320B